MEVPTQGSYDYSRNYNYAKKVDVQDKPFAMDGTNERTHSSSIHHNDIRPCEGTPKKDGIGIKAELPVRSMKDESTNTILSLGGHSSTMCIIKDTDGKGMNQGVEWCHKIEAEEIAHFLDVNIAMRDTEMKYNPALGPASQKEVGRNVQQATSPAYKENCSAAERNRLLMQQAFVHSHTGVKPFSCGICHKFFNQASHLQQHIRTHTGERPYVCTLCSHTFTRMSDLKRHMRTHTGEKPYKCAVCNNMFGDVSHLKTHMRTHTGEKPYTCSVCSKSFARQSSLKRHMRTHNTD